MLENIREIGIFMIAAQAVVHFAPGRQYEKYIKSVSGIIILLLFLRPFLQLSGAEWKEPEAVLEKLEELEDMPVFSGAEGGADQVTAGGVGVDAQSTLISRMEGEVKELLNREIEGEDYRVKRVALQLTKDPSGEGETMLAEVEITMEKAAVDGESRIGIDEIVIGEEPDPSAESVFSIYRERFASLLEIEEERVEVRRNGGG